jgi:hypothetical protein
VEIRRQLQETDANTTSYLQALPTLVEILAASLNEMWSKYSDAMDSFGVLENLKQLSGANERKLAAALALHNKVLHQVDALQTKAIKGNGDLADILFTVRLQSDVYKLEKLASSQRFWDLLKATEHFIQAYASERGGVATYVPFVSSLVDLFEITVSMIESGVLKARYAELVVSPENTPEAVQKAHLNFLNTLLLL